MCSTVEGNCQAPLVAKSFFIVLLEDNMEEWSTNMVGAATIKERHSQ